MAKLEIPQEQIGGQMTGLQDGAQSYAGAAASIGDVAQSFGADVMRQGKSYFEEARAAIDDSLANHAYSKANVEYAQRVQERMSRTTDENGMPTFETLSQDIDNIGLEVQNKYSSMLLSQGANAQFSQRFGSVRQQSSVAALEQARNQQLQFAQASFLETTNTVMDRAISGPEPIVESSIAELDSMVDRGVAAGYIDPVQAVKLKEQNRKNVVTGRAYIANSNDPVAVQKRLEAGETFGFKDPVELQKFKEQNKDAVREFESREKRMEAERASALAKQQSLAEAQIKLGIVEGKMGTPDIDEAEKNGLISAQQAAELKIYNIKQSETKDKKQQIANAISANIQAKDPLNEFSSEDIQAHAQSTLQVATLDANGNPTNKLSSVQKVDLLAGYLAPLPFFGKEINAKILSNDPNEVLDGVQALEAATTKNPIMVQEGVSSEAVAIAAVVSSLRTTSTPIEEVIKSAKEQVLNKDESVLKLRDSGFNTAFKDEPGEVPGSAAIAAIQKELGVDEIDSAYKGPMLNILKEGYRRTGTSDGALKFLKKVTGSTYGASAFNGEDPGTFQGAAWADTKRLTYLPIERQYPRYESKSMRQEFEADLTDIAASYGVDPRALKIRPAPGASNEPGKTHYNVYYMDGDMEIVITEKDSPTNKALEWWPDSDIQDKANIEALQQQQKDIEGQKSLYEHIRSSRAENASYMMSPPATPESGTIKTLADSIAHVETGYLAAAGKNPYSALGKTIPKGQYAGERALGRYQIMPGNLPWLSKKYIGRNVSPQEFLNNPALQDKIAMSWMKDLHKQYGNVEDVMSVWLTGRPLSKGGNARDQVTGMSGNEYVKRGMAYYTSKAAKSPEEIDPDGGDSFSPTGMTIKQDSLLVQNQANLFTPRTYSAIGEMGYNINRQLNAKGIRFEMGGKNPSSGMLDCSGYVAHQTLQIMNEMNKGGKVYNMNAMSRILNQPIANIITGVGAKAGYVKQSDLVSGNVQPGTIIGLKRAKVPPFARYRPLQISHAAQVVMKNGKLYVSEIVRKTGVSLTEYKTWIEDKIRSGNTVYATNPFTLVGIK